MFMWPRLTHLRILWEAGGHSAYTYTHILAHSCKPTLPNNASVGS